MVLEINGKFFRVENGKLEHVDIVSFMKGYESRICSGIVHKEILYTFSDDDTIGVWDLEKCTTIHYKWHNKEKTFVAI